MSEGTDSGDLTRRGPRPSHSSHAQSGPWALVAEADAAVRGRLVAACAHHGFSVDEARNEAELRALFPRRRVEDRRPPALVVLGAALLRGSGPQALRATLRHAVVLVMADKGDESAFREAREVGAFGVLEGPVRDDVLRAAVSHLLHRSPDA